MPLANLKDRKHRKDGFRVPLSSRALEIVGEMEQARASLFVFPGQVKGHPFSNMAFLTLLKRMNSDDNRKWVDPSSGKPITAHGFRATFRTWAEEIRPLIEAAAADTPDAVPMAGPEASS